MEHRMEQMYAEMDNNETEEEFMSNYPPIRPERSRIDLSDQAEQILYHCRKTVGYFLECLEMDYEHTEIVGAINDIRQLEMLLQLWYETSPEGVAWQDWRRDEERFHAHKMAERAKAKAEEEEGLEF